MNDKQIAKISEISKEIEDCQAILKIKGLVLVPNHTWGLGGYNSPCYMKSTNTQQEIDKEFLPKFKDFISRREVELKRQLESILKE